MREYPPKVKQTKNGWYIIVTNLTARYTYGPFVDCPDAQMQTWTMEEINNTVKGELFVTIKWWHCFIPRFIAMRLLKVKSKPINTKDK